MLHAEVPVEPRNSRSAWTIFRVEELCHHCGASTVGPPGDIGRRACFAAVARVSVDHEVEIAADRRIVRFVQPTAADGGPATPPDRASPTEELGERALGLRRRLLRHLKQRGHGSIGRYRVPMRPATIRRGRRAAGSRFRTRSVTMIEANGLATGRDAAVGQAGATGGRLERQSARSARCGCIGGWAEARRPRRRAPAIRPTRQRAHPATKLFQAWAKQQRGLAPGVRATDEGRRRHEDARSEGTAEGTGGNGLFDR